MWWIFSLVGLEKLGKMKLERFGRNARTFTGESRSMPALKLYFLQSLFYWLKASRIVNSDSLTDMIDMLFLYLISWLLSVYTSCVHGGSPFLINKIIIYQKKKKKKKRVTVETFLTCEKNEKKKCSLSYGLQLSNIKRFPLRETTSHFIGPPHRL
jgi:hypothetical protein